MTVTTTTWNERGQATERIQVNDDGSSYREIWQLLAAKPLFTVRMTKLAPDGAYSFPEDVATGLTRRSAARLAGLLLMSPLHSQASLVAEPIPGRWVKAPEGVFNT